MDPMEVEVRRKNGAYYKAYVTDVFKHTVSVAFEDDWLPQSNFAFHLVRLAAPEDKCLKNYKKGDEIEVSTRFNESEYSGWWIGIIRMIKGQFLVVEYSGLETNHMEVVPLIRVRHKNPNPSITKKSFFKFDIKVPNELHEYSKKKNIYRVFQDSIGAPICRYIPGKGVLSIISRDQRSKIKADMLKDLLFKNMRQKLLLLKMTEKAAKQLEMVKIDYNVGSCNADYDEDNGRKKGGLSKSKGHGGAKPGDKNDKEVYKFK